MVKVNKELAKIVPCWAKKIESKAKLIDAYAPCTIDGKELDITTHSNCMVGEAHGFSWEYARNYVAGSCTACEEFSMNFFSAVKYNASDGHWERLQEKFMVHWKEVHAGGELNG